LESNPDAEELDRIRSLVAPRLRAAVQRLPAPMCEVAGYHFGWLDAQGQPATGGGTGGKAIRPALVVLCAQAVGGAAEASVGAATAVELVHNFSLLHDDVIDEDRTRRHRPTAWAVFGVPAAILAGDALLALANEVLTTDYPELAGPGVSRLTGTVVRLVQGQCADVAFETRTDVTLLECLEMAASKTGALLACSCELGALVGGADIDRAQWFRRFGEHLGLLFQLVDDLLGIWGDPRITGKPVRSDLRTRKKSLPVVAALTAGNRAGDRLATLYHDPQPLSEEKLESAAGLVDQAGGRAWALQRVKQEASAALSCLRTARPTPAAAARLESLVQLLSDRDR
jgi:geranylgeranyl diphosphate synthase type I